MTHLERRFFQKLRRKITTQPVFFILLCNVVCLTCAKPTDDDPFPLLVPGGGIGGIFKGANKETIIQGPDGSVITAENEPGIIVQSHALKEPKKETVVVEQPVATVEKIATIVQPIKTLVQDVRPIATASIAPTQIITSNNNFLKGEILNAPVARGSVLETKRILVPRPKPVETTIVEQPSQPALFTPQQPLLPTKFSFSTLAPQQDLYAPKISLAPQKITLSSTPAPPVLSASTLAPPLLSSTLAPRIISSTLGPQFLSSTLDPKDLQGFSSTISSENLIDSGRIDLGGGDIRIAIPVVEYASSNGFVNNARAEILGYNVAQTTARIDDVSNVNWVQSVTGSPLKDTQNNIEDNSLYATNLPPITQGVGFTTTPLLYKRSALQRRQIYNNGFMPQSYTYRRTSNIQKIPKYGPKSIRIDDKIDMGHEYRTYRGLNNRNSDTVQVPETLRTQLAQYLPRQRHSESDNRGERVVIDGKMGSLEENEIFQQPRQFYASQNSLPALTQSSGLFPLRLSPSDRNNLAELDVSGNNRNLYEAELSDVRAPPPIMLPPRRQFLTLEDKIESDLWNRYGRDTKKSRK